MKQREIIVITMSLLMALLILLGGCGQDAKPDSSVVVYTSVDQIYAEPILNEFQESSGIKVQAIYDVEAAKTTGLVNRLIAEKNNPQADVFWNGEFAQTILLKQEGVLTPYESPSAQDIPESLIDPEGYWAGAGGRCRVILVNTELMVPEDYPDSIFDLLDEKYPADKIGIAYPLFGTTATHAAALYAYLGPEEGKKYFAALKDRGVMVVDGNSVVRDMVADGRLAMGLTDTDDAVAALEDGKPVKMIFPDQDDMGTLIIPYTTGLVAGGPNPDAGQQLIDYLLSKEVEKKIFAAGFSQVTVRPLDIEAEYLPDSGVKAMQVNITQAYEQLELIKEELRQIFIR